MRTIGIVFLIMLVLIAGFFAYKSYKTKTSFWGNVKDEFGSIFHTGATANQPAVLAKINGQ